MARRITPETTLDNFKKEAKRWLRELRANNLKARARFEHAYPSAPAKPGLRDVQRALALEYGFPGWTALKQAVEKGATSTTEVEETRAQIVARFLDYACPDHHVRGRPAHRIARHAAMRILQQHPEIARDNIYTAVVCGEVEDVERILRNSPHVANQKSSATAPGRSAVGGAEDIFKDIGPKGWEPLLYLCFTRLTADKANNNAVTIARMLLDHGANPNAFFMAGDSRYTPLVGVIGEGEEDRPPHPRRDELAHLLFERGAEPYDIQVIYNIHFHGKILWYMKLMYEFAVNAGRKADWKNPEWPMFDMGSYGSGARWHLSIAVQRNDLELAEWCLSHEANANAAPPSDERFSQRSLYEEAVRAGHTDMAELLARYGAPRTAVALQGEEAFALACLRLDRAEASRLMAPHPEYLRSKKALLAALRHDRADVVELLLDLGLDVDFEYEHRQRPLHLAAAEDAVRVAELLINRGAQIDPVESNWNNTPIDFAVWHEYPRMMELLGRHTRDAGNLTFIGNVPRLREVLTERPERAKLNWGETPLFWLSEDEEKALEIIDLFLAHGADAGFRRKDGRTAADIARRRGLHRAAARLETASQRPSGDVAKYERLAEDMVTAYATGDAAAMQRINEHYGRSSTVDDLRATVWRLMYKVRQARGSAAAFGRAEAQELIVRTSGFNSWTALTEAVVKGAPPTVPAYTINTKESRIALRREVSEKEWDTVIGVMTERRISAMDANGFMTDNALKRIAELGHVTSLNLGGSRQLSDGGLHHLARMAQLENLDLSEYPGGKLTDRGLEVLRHLPNLRMFEMTWQRGISDAGVANLRFCEKLESVNLMGSPTGDGAIDALRGKPRLRRLDTGRL
ncbi:MAG: ankyrin repeat domain-containing protein, partial [Acidobacteria bacterium]|nr:ankyrin repeat domain-containing protein [Acidobacteriota bacterium]